MGKKKENGLAIEHKVLAEHLVAAAMRYHNLVQYMRKLGRQEARERIPEYQRKCDECIAWAEKLDHNSINHFRDYVTRQATFRHFR